MSISSIMKMLHERAKKMKNGFFGIGKTYRKLLADEITSYWSSVKINREMRAMSVEQMDGFYSGYKSIN